MSLRETAKKIKENLIEAGFTSKIGQVLMVVEETGEFSGAYRRWAGLARRPGPWSDVEEELADVVIGSYVCAEYIGVDLDAAIERKLIKIFGRGWREVSANALTGKDNSQ